MKTENHCRAILAEMKVRRGEDTIILFHVGNSFETYDEDAITAAAVLGLTSEIRDEVTTLCFPQENQEAYTNRLLDAGYSVCISEMRNKSNQFIADIAEQEKQEDE